jgi:hypothetical protein
MKNTSPWITITVVVSPGCHCERAMDQPMDTDATSTTSTSEASAGASFGSHEVSTGAPFDASRWIGRYHFEDGGLEFGERGTPLGAHMLVNFEIFPDSTASMLYDDCSFDEPMTIAYGWTPAEPGWLELHPGAGESSLRLLAAKDIASLRIHLVEPCRELEFELEGVVHNFFDFYPGESCWLERCLVGNTMRVDYCPGEEPPPCP